MKRRVPRTHKQIEAANERAKTLLLSLLTSEQKKELATSGYITVRGGTTKRKYIILQGVAGNVYHQASRTHYCCHMDINAPVHDHMIAQMFHLRYNEEAFLKKAYKSIY